MQPFFIPLVRRPLQQAVQVKKATRLILRLVKVLFLLLPLGLVAPRETTKPTIFSKEKTLMREWGSKEDSSRREADRWRIIREIKSHINSCLVAARRKGRGQSWQIRSIIITSNRQRYPLISQDCQIIGSKEIAPNPQKRDQTLQITNLADPNPAIKTIPQPKSVKIPPKPQPIWTPTLSPLQQHPDRPSQPSQITRTSSYTITTQ
jgi:hypothetical protein